MPVARDLLEIDAAYGELSDDVREGPVAWRLHLENARPHLAHQANVANPDRGNVGSPDDAANLQLCGAEAGERRDATRIDALDAVLQRQRDATLDLAYGIAAHERRLGPELRELLAKRILIPGHLAQELRIVDGERMREPVLRRGRITAYSCRHPSDGLLPGGFDAHLRGEAQPDDVKHRIVVERDRATRQRCPPDAAEAGPEPFDAVPVVEVGLATLADHPRQILVGIDDRPFRIGEIRVHLVAPVRRSQQRRRRGSKHRPHTTAAPFGQGHRAAHDQGGSDEQNSQPFGDAPYTADEMAHLLTSVWTRRNRTRQRYRRGSGAGRSPES